MSVNLNHKVEQRNQRKGGLVSGTCKLKKKEWAVTVERDLSVYRLSWTHGGLSDSDSVRGGGRRRRVCESQSEAHRLGHLWRRGSRHPEGHLHGVVYEPLQRRQRTDHHDTQRQTLQITHNTVIHVLQFTHQHRMR